MRYDRVPHRVVAERLSSSWQWATANGDLVRADAGDYRVTDPSTGTRWSVTPRALAAGYVSLGAGGYESRGQVTARRLEPGSAPVTIRSLEGPETALPGDWIVTDQDGNDWVVADAWFARRYRAADEVSAPAPARAVGPPGSGPVPDTVAASAGHVIPGGALMQGPAAAVPPVRVFVSHASADRDVAVALTSGLRDEGLDVWLAVDDIHAGENYAEEIFAALVASDAVVVLLSRPAIESPHVRREMNLAIDRRKKILPFSREVALTSGPELPIDWRYWLGVLQVEPLDRIADAVRLVVERTRRTPPRPVAARRAAAGDAREVSGAIRTILIQIASEHQDFGAFVGRCHHLRRSRAELVSELRRLRDRGLVAFDEPLDDSTPITLST